MGETPQPLDGLRVLELATGISGPYAGKLLADFGADVVKIEPSGGDPARRESPREGERPDRERSPLFLHLNANKRSIELADDDAAERALIEDLIGRTDIVIESTTPGRHPRGLSPEELCTAYPALVVLSVTPFGQVGDYIERSGGDLVAYAMGGPMRSTGDPQSPPIKLAGNVVQYQTGALGALTALAAHRRVETTGRGAHVDVNEFRTQASSIDRRAALMVNHLFTGVTGVREGGNRAGPVPAGIYPTADGHCQIVFPPNWMSRVADMLGDEELIERYAQPDWMNDDELSELLPPAIFGWTLQRTKQEAMTDAQAQGLAVTPVNATTDVLRDPHFRQRGAWQTHSHPVVGDFEAPGAPFRMHSGWRHRRPAPLLDQHREEIIGEAASSGSRATPGVGADRLPLDGIRVVDLTVVWAGPLATMLLGDLGAEVIKLDNPLRFPTASRGAVPRPQEGRETDFGQYWGGFPEGRAGERPWNRVAAFVCHARNKLGATVDLRSNVGREAFLQLIERSDVFVENNSAKVLDALGIGWEALHERNPRLVVVRMPSLGLDGPYRDYVGFGAHMEALTGMTSLRGYRDQDPSVLDATYFMDPASGVNAAFAVLAALRRRDRTGVGELIEFAQAENLLNYVGEYFVDASLTGRPHDRHENRHPHRAPQGVYQCTGDDQWLVISVEDDAQWSELAALVGGPFTDAALATEAARRERHDEIDAVLSAWTADRDRDDAVAALLHAGVTAGPVYDEHDLCRDTHLRRAGFFRSNQGRDVPETALPGHLFDWSGPPLRWTALNSMGADNDYVWRTVAGLGDITIEALERSGQLSLDFLGPDGAPL